VYAWSTQVFDEAAAQEFFALDVDSGESYTAAWYRHRLPEGQALTDRLSTESLCANAPHYSAEFGCRGKDGRVGWFDERVYLEPAPCPEGALGCWRVVGIAIDITERKRAEDALRASAEALQTAHQQTVEILESIGDAFYAVDHAWRFTYVNRRAEGIWGARREDLLGKNLWEVFPHSVGSQIHQELFRAARERQPAEFEMFSSVLGRWLAVKISPTETGLSVYFDDITERKRAEEERRAFLRDVLASVTEGKLRLCDRATDLPARLAPVGEPVSLVAATLRRLRHQALEATRALGFPKDRGEDLISAAGEAGMNAVTHAGGGTGFVGADPRAGVVQVWIEDQGGGIEVGRLPRATLERGWTTIPGNFGHGFWLMLQTVDRVWLLTGTTGTTVVLEQNKKAPESGWLGST
jgi:PAS domain S-box-containing protein